MVRRLTVTETEALTVRVEPALFPSRIDVGETPLIVRFFDTVDVPTQVPLTSRVSPALAASIAPCRELKVAVEVSTSQDFGAAFAVDPIPSSPATSPSNPSTRRLCRTERRKQCDFSIVISLPRFGEQPPALLEQSTRKKADVARGSWPHHPQRKRDSPRLRSVLYQSRTLAARAGVCPPATPAAVRQKVLICRQITGRDSESAFWGHGPSSTGAATAKCPRLSTTMPSSPMSSRRVWSRKARP